MVGSSLQLLWDRILIIFILSRHFFMSEICCLKLINVDFQIITIVEKKRAQLTASPICLCYLPSRLITRASQRSNGRFLVLNPQKRTTRNSRSHTKIFKKIYIFWVMFFSTKSTPFNTRMFSYFIIFQK